MKIFKIILVILGGFAIIIGLMFLTGYIDVFYTKTVGKAKQNAQREVFEETQSYVEGKRQEILKIKLEYAKGDAETKIALKSHVVNQFANIDEDKWLEKGYITLDIRNFIHKMKQ